MATSSPVAGRGELLVSVTPQADRHGPPDEMAAIGGQPDRHRAVAFAHHAVVRDRRRAHRRAGADDEVGEHAGAQQVLRIADLGAHQHAARCRVDRRGDGGDRAVEHAAGNAPTLTWTFCPTRNAGLSVSVTLASIHMVLMSATVYGAGSLPGCT